MTGTSRAQRAAPERRFENYVLTRVVEPGPGITGIIDSAFTQLSGPADGTGFNVGQGFCDNGLSNLTPIGFDFQLDGITYKQFVATTNGWMALVDPQNGSFSQSEVVASSSDAQYKNPLINATFSSNAVLLAPWFDDLRNVANVATQLESSPFGFTAEKVNRVVRGLDPRPTQFSQVAYGVSSFNDVRSRRGRRLIVRWNSLSDYVAPSTVLKFEVVLYENGTIEYRYVPRGTISASPTTQIEGATIGIFMPNGTNRFRDFAVGLGYRDNDRSEGTYGGFTYSSAYSDTKVDSGTHSYTATAPYTVNLQPFYHWPGSDVGGSVFTFSPPVNRRKVLPRALLPGKDAATTLPLVARTGDSRLGTSLSGFDDRRSPTYTSTLSGSPGFVAGRTSVVNFPTTLSRFFGGTAAGTLERQDLFTGDFMVTASVSRAAGEQYAAERPEQGIEAFSEVSRYDQPGPVTVPTSSFFQVGTDPNYVGQGLDQRLQSKTQVRISLNVQAGSTMPACTSSIYYYNSRTKSWNVPSNTTYVLAPTASAAPPSGSFPGGDWAKASFQAGGTRELVIEDARGFGAFGQAIGSGSSRQGLIVGQTDASFGLFNPYTPQAAISAMQRNLAKSVRNNSEYRPTPDECFTLPIATPFLIEKAVIELPFAAGPGWFNDKTRTFNPLGVEVLGEQFASFDVAGPALTVALMRQVQESANSDYPSRRDLILTGTFTHALDYVTGVAIDKAPPLDTMWHVNPIGFLSYANPAAGVVNPDSSNHFTGSVQLRCEALSSAGVVAYYYDQLADVTASVAAAITRLLSIPTLPLTASYLNGSGLTTFISNVSPLGRGGTGFAPSGRSVFGNELVTFQGLADQTGRTVPNPFYVGPQGLTPQQQAVLTPADSTLTGSHIAAAIPVASHFASPYLVLPGDKLVLSVSKMRPYLFTGNLKTDAFSGSAHDVNLMPGTINITLYGSLLQQGEEFHDTLNQSLGSDAVHELIGAEPVLDQFEVAYRFELSGSYTDNVITGSLVSVLPLNTVLNDVDQNGNLVTTSLKSTQIVTGTRGLAYSSLTADSSLLPETPLASNTVAGPYLQSQFDFPFKSTRLVQNHERAGDPRVTTFIDSTERWYDSMMPSVFEAFAADGTGIFIAPSGSKTTAFANPYQVSGLGVVGSLAQGWIYFDGQTELSFPTIVNANWTKAFPFEPRYSGISRQQRIEKSFLASYQFDGSTLVPIQPTPVNGFFFGPVGQGVCARIHNAGPTYDFVTNLNAQYWVSDVNLSSVYSGSPGTFFTTGSATVDDASRALFGFGDFNSYRLVTNFDSTTSLIGTGHFADSRDREGPHPDGTNYEPPQDRNTFLFSPVIRGWKYGVMSGVPMYNKAHWRRGRFGQNRDMLEQRPYGTMYNTFNVGPATLNIFGTSIVTLQVQPQQGIQPGLQPSVVEVKFVESLSGNTTAPENTWSSNLDLHCTSSMPYFDGVSTNRPPINQNLLNKQISTISSDARGNVSL